MNAVWCVSSHVTNAKSTNWSDVAIGLRGEVGVCVCAFTSRGTRALVNKAAARGPRLILGQWQRDTGVFRLLD